MLSCCPRLSVCPIFSFFWSADTQARASLAQLRRGSERQIDTSVKQGARLAGIIGLWLEGPSHRSSNHETIREIAETPNDETKSRKARPRLILGTAPPPGRKRPPCDSTIRRLIDSPMPVPCGFVVKKASKMRSLSSGSPVPESVTEINN